MFVAYNQLCLMMMMMLIGDDNDVDVLVILLVVVCKPHQLKLELVGCSSTAVLITISAC